MRSLIRIFKNISIAFVSFILLILLTSCAGAIELDTLGIVVSTGIDLEDGKIVVTNEVINPSMNSQEGPVKEQGTTFVQGTGVTVIDALANTLITFDRQVYYAHNQLVIFGEEFAKQGIGQYIDLLSRGTEQREVAYLLVAKGKKAYDVMGINSGIANSPGKYMYDILKGELYNGQTRTLTINEFLKYYYRQSEGYIFGVVDVVQKPQINKMTSTNTLDVLCVDGGAIFEDDKLVGYYTGQEMIGFNILVNNLKSTNIVFEAPENPKDKKKKIATEGKYSVVKVFKSKTKLDIKLEGEELHLYVDVKIRGPLIETMQLLNLSDSKVLKTTEEACAKKVEENINITLNKAQKEFGIDSFSIGELVHRTYPKLWKEIENDWGEIFTNLDYTINVQVAIVDTGFTNTPPNARKGNLNE